MSLSLEGIVSMISEEKPNDTDVMDKLKHYFSEYWDGDDKMFSEVKMLSKSKLGAHMTSIVDTASYFEALENNFSDSSDLLEFLINVTGYLNYHTELGGVKVDEKLKRMRRGLQRVRLLGIQKGIFKDKYFVGREEEIKQMTHEIVTGTKKGILVHGMGGMGKTSLTRTVCYDLRGENWKTIKIELREQRSFRHLLRKSLQSINKNDILGSTYGHTKTTTNDDDKENIDETRIEEDALQQKFLDELKMKKDIQTIFLFDNIDDIQDIEEKLKMMAFFQNILCSLNADSKIRIIVTCREDFLGVPGSELAKYMSTIEAKKLTRTDAKHLVRLCTKQMLEEKYVNMIIHKTGSCPLAIRVLTDVINKLALDNNDLCLIEERLSPILSSVCGISGCINQPFQSLEEENQQILCMCSLLGTSKFSLEYADKLLNEDESVNRDPSTASGAYITRLLTLKLRFLLYKRLHLLEVDNEEAARSNQNHTEMEFLQAESAIYSFHPLISEYLRETRKWSKFSSCMAKANYNFFYFIDNLVQNIGTEYDSNVLTAREKYEQYSHNISLYAELMKQLNEQSMTPFSHNVAYEDLRTRNNVFQMVMKPDYHLQYLEAVRNTYEVGTQGYIFWEIERMETEIRNDRFTDNMGNHCTDIFNELQLLEATLEDANHRTNIRFAMGRVKYCEGRWKMETADMEVEKSFKEAETIFTSPGLRHEKQCKIYLADIYNCLGSIQYQNHNSKEALKLHEKALHVLKKQNKQNERIATFLGNIGACHFRTGIEFFRMKDKTQFNRNMEQALESYNNCITIGLALKMENTPTYVKALKNRSDVLAMLSRFQDAEKGYEECLCIVKSIYKSPSLKEILMQHAMGSLVRKIILDQKRASFSGEDEQPDDEKYQLIERGLAIYENLQKMLRPYVIHRDHAEFSKIEKQHLYFLKQNHENEKLESAKSFYSKYGAKSIQDDNSSDSDISTDQETSSNDSALESEGSPFGTTLKYEDMEEFKIPSLPSADDVEMRQHNRQSSSGVSSLGSTSSNVSSNFTRKSSSGISSLGSTASNRERPSFESQTSLFAFQQTQEAPRREANLPRQGSSLEDDVFDPGREKLRSNSAWSERRSILSTFGSKSSEKSRDYDGDDVDAECCFPNGKRKIIETNGKQTKRPRSSNIEMNFKMFDCGEKTRDIGVQTDPASLELLIHEMDQHLKIEQTKMAVLMTELESGNAILVDDKKGRPTVQYKETK